MIPNNENYPQQIIPKVTYKREIDISQINSPPLNFILARRSLKDHNNTFDNLGYLRRDALVNKLSDAIGLSMYFVTKIHNDNFIKFRTFNSASKYWNEGVTVKFSDYSKYFEIITPYCPIYFNLNDIDRKKIPYKKNFAKKEKQKILEKLNIDINQIDNFELTGETKIKHKPIILNYWHVELHIESDKLIDRGKIISDIKTKWKERLVEYAVSDILTIHGKRKIQKNYTNEMPTHLYKESINKFLLKRFNTIMKNLFRIT